MTRLNTIIGKFLALLTTTLLGIMVLVVLWQILSRYFLGSPSSWTEELARYLLIWVGLFGAALLYRERGHLGLDIFQEKASPAGRHRMIIACDALAALFALFVLIGGGASLVQLTWELRQTSAAMALPMAFVYAALPLSGLFILMFSLEDIFINARSNPVNAKQDNSGDHPTIGGVV
ncbi:TRAP transporter small permease [Kordiimonas sp.]|uniref:TRAP transporter small permease n=1 Tax=Kordiimonas sp. TaxID=1970157 RepID=UPI003A951851